MTIHPSAVIEDGARLGDGVEIGPFCHVGPDAVLGDRVRLHANVVIAGRTTIGADSVVWPFASLGHQPQDLKFSGESSRLEIGQRNMIREHVTMNPGTEGGGLLTSVGDGGLFMVGTHVAHDCRIGDGVIMANNATLAGHVTVGDGAILGGLSAVHQHVRIGQLAMVGGMSGVEKDVIPFGSVIGNRADLGGLNLIGLKRRGVGREAIHALRATYKMLFTGEGTLSERADRVAAEHGAIAEVVEMLTFVRAGSSRSFCTPREV